MSLNKKKINIENEDASKITLPLLPLRGILVFPHMTLPLEVGRDKSIEALEVAMNSDRMIALFTQKQAKVNEPNSEDIYTVGCLAEIKQMVKLPDGTVRAVVEGKSRLMMTEFYDETTYNSVECFVHVESTGKNNELSALMRDIFTDFENYVKVSKRIPPEILVSTGAIEDAGRFADDVAGSLPLKVEEKQSVLEAFDVMERLQCVSDFINQETEIMEIERRIHLRVRKQMDKAQKEYYLREQIKAIQKELGEKDERQAEVDELNEKIAKLNLPDTVRDKVNHEIERLEKMPPMAAEAVVVRTYLDWVMSLPWNVYTEDKKDIDEAQNVLDQDHWGLDKVKERIIEFLAVRSLSKDMKSPILCLVGPPGVGKTSLAKSVARALGRKFVRFSLGGVRDEAEIRGHRRTYIGAMPGKLIQVLRQAGSSNPVILLDEIDKMASDFRGDPASALLEVLDPEQNCNFSDHYMEVEYDLSKVLFITTANVLYSIPSALSDRMEIISLPGYTEDEKFEIAKAFLVKRQIAENGLLDTDVVFPNDGLMNIIRKYTRESGVRSLDRKIATVCRKIACDVVKGSKSSFVVDEAFVEKTLGVPLFKHGEIEGEDKVGVVTGLAWTEMGGEILSIEVSTMEGTGKLILTGQLGEVMRESAQAGYTYVRSRAKELGIDPDFYQNRDVHIHIPEGAIPKDGPSAGIAMATALVSALTHKPVFKEVAMTGEITLRGRVLPIGGLKEKSIAAHRAGIKTVIYPEENARDMEEIPDNIKKSMDFIKVSHVDEVLALALSQIVSNKEEIENLKIPMNDLIANPIIENSISNN